MQVSLKQFMSDYQHNHDNSSSRAAAVSPKSSPYAWLVERSLRTPPSPSHPCTDAASDVHTAQSSGFQGAPPRWHPTKPAVNDACQITKVIKAVYES